jgi:hypothetical protein
MKHAGQVNGRGDCCRDSGGGNRRCAWMTETQMGLTNNDTLVGSMDDIQKIPPKWLHWFYQVYGENIWATHRGWLRRPLVEDVPPPLSALFVRRESLVGGNCGIQKCDSMYSLSLVIKCLGGEGYKSRDLKVLSSDVNKPPFLPGGQVNTHTWSRVQFWYCCIFVVFWIISCKNACLACYPEQSWLPTALQRHPYRSQKTLVSLDSLGILFLR